MRKRRKSPPRKKRADVVNQRLKFKLGTSFRQSFRVLKKIR